VLAAAAAVRSTFAGWQGQRRRVVAFAVVLRTMAAVAVVVAVGCGCSCCDDVCCCAAVADVMRKLDVAWEIRGTR
jgi:hypothetical protein